MTNLEQRGALAFAFMAAAQAGCVDTCTRGATKRETAEMVR
jgi:hypothetical protein